MLMCNGINISNPYLLLVSGAYVGKIIGLEIGKAEAKQLLGEFVMHIPQNSPYNPVLARIKFEERKLSIVKAREDACTIIGMIIALSLLIWCDL